MTPVDSVALVSAGGLFRAPVTPISGLINNADRAKSTLQRFDASFHGDDIGHANTSPECGDVFFSTRIQSPYHAFFGR
jgi:hypothetical protein